MAQPVFATKVPKKSKSVKSKPVVGGMELYLKRIFSLMFAAVSVSALVCWFTLYGGGLDLLINFEAGRMTPLYYIASWGGLFFAIWAQVRAFRMKPAAGAACLFFYAALIGFVMAPLIWVSISVNPIAILQAFIIAALMFACMALFGYKTTKDLSFMGVFLRIGMIGLILVALFSMFWPLGSTFATIVCLIGVLVFALFTAYDMQTLKRAYTVIGGDTQRNQLAVLGALHLYVAFIAMFQYILSLLNNRS